MAFISVTYTFVNGSSADATQVNQNFTDIINGTSDGTKSFNISALTCAGAATFNNAITLGQASNNDLTFNGSIASSIPVKTNTSFDIGAATLGLRSVYIGGSGTKTVRLLGPTLSNTYTMTLPTDVAAGSNYAVTSDNSGVLSFTPKSLWTRVASKTGTYSILATDEYVPGNTDSAGFTMTLPTAAGVGGKMYILHYVGTLYANALTIATTSAQTIGPGSATSTTLNTPGEMLKVISDGSNWQIISRTYDSSRTSFTWTLSGTGGGLVKGTTAVDAGYWWRYGNGIFYDLTYRQTAGGTAGAGNYNWLLPNSWSIDSTATVSTSPLNATILGNGVVSVSAANMAPVTVFGYDSTHLALYYGNVGATPALVAATQYDVSNAATTYGFRGWIPISGWKAWA